MLRELLNRLAPLIANDWTIVIVALLLCCWAGWSAWRLRLGPVRLRSALDAASDLLEKTRDAAQFAGDFERISRAMSADAVIGARWREFAASLARTPDAGGRLRPTRSCEEWFNTGLLRSGSIYINLRYHAALPNLFVGAGLLFTFLGLAAALTSAGGVMEGDAAVRSRALRSLLDAASAKFITSLVGLFLSIVYALYLKHVLAKVDAALDRFTTLLEARAPKMSAMELQWQANALQERQLATAEGFANEFSFAMAQALDQAFDKRLGEHIQPLTQAMQDLAARMSTSNEAAMGQMLDAFLQRLQGGAGDRMQDVTASLERLGGRLDGLQAGLGDAAMRMAQSADAMSQRMGEGAQAAMARVGDQIASVVDTLRAVADDTRGAGAQAGRELAESLRAAASGFESTAAAVAGALEEAGKQTGGAFGQGAEAAVQRIAEATESMRDDMRALIREFHGAAVSAGEEMHKRALAGAQSMGARIDGAGETVAQVLARAGESLSEAGQAAGAALRAGGAAAGVEMERAGAGFGGRADALSRQAAALATATDGAAQRLGELGRAVEAAARPLTASATDLRAAGEMARGLAQPLTQAVTTAGRAAEQFSVAGERVAAAHANTGRLAEELAGAVGRFEGLDHELAGVLEALQTGLQGFRIEVEKTVARTDENLGKAVQQLGNSIKSLEEMLEPLVDSIPQGGRP